jgi:hypothetical protein
MKGQNKKRKEQKRTYKKPLLTKHTKLTDVTAGTGTAVSLGCTRF